MFIRIHSRPCIQIRLPDFTMCRLRPEIHADYASLNKTPLKCYHKKKRTEKSMSCPGPERMKYCTRAPWVQGWKAKGTLRRLNVLSHPQSGVSEARPWMHLPLEPE